MITIDQQADYVAVSVFAEFTLHDFREFEENVLYRIQFEGKPNLLFDMTAMSGYTIDTMVEEVKFGRKHRADFGRVAIVSSDQWVTWTAWLNQLFSEAQIQVFDRVDDARFWVERGDGGVAAA
ncbi:STAS/SEC14 domain-containing protein [Amantichitinum ursilacus]|uniref:SpoIIAA-like protein n=1 Tax=Amantichitinum ursilacus TaxID=857265 RepID=A0A0N0XL41_9NEIS|nr:STAS/SEC14 domain-containing protein [Amantichitinum ursilacus]KPC52988.1 hypothetical protein WG78_10875 [Amantichitinum ursilacus]